MVREPGVVSVYQMKSSFQLNKRVDWDTLTFLVTAINTHNLPVSMRLECRAEG